MSHVVHYGSSIFEGLRCYGTPTGGAVFRLREHMRRFVDSAKIYKMPLRYDVDALCEAVTSTITANGLDQCYIRPLAVRAGQEMGVNPLNAPVQTYVICWIWGAYLGNEALEQGVDFTASSWRRAAPGTLVAIARDLGYEVREALLPREFLLVADEVFFTGTAAEITPIRSIDRTIVGEGRRGPVTRAIQERYLAICTGMSPDTRGWLTPVPPATGRS